MLRCPQRKLFLQSQRTQLPPLLLSVLLMLMPQLLMPPVSIANPINSNARTGTFQPPPPPEIEQPEGRIRGGASRSPGCERYADLTPLVPTVQVGDRSFNWGLTTQTHPTFWLYSPTGLEAGLPLELTITDATQQMVYRSLQNTTVMPPGSFSVKANTPAPSLEPNQVYYWSIALFCDPDLPDTPVTVGAYIQRTEFPTPFPNVTDPRQQSAIYAHAGIWYDALMVLGDRYESAIAPTWSHLLQQVNLNQASNTPVGTCCSANP